MQVFWGLVIGFTVMSLAIVVCHVHEYYIVKKRMEEEREMLKKWLDNQGMI